VLTPNYRGDEANAGRRLRAAEFLVAKTLGDVSSKDSANPV
jgi:hypothetical protein